MKWGVLFRSNCGAVARGSVCRAPSLEGYEFCVLDCAYFVAALVLIGDIIRSFDSP